MMNLLSIGGSSMNKKANSGIALVIFGVVGIIAVIGLVLLFTRASAAGAAVGNSYGWQGEQRGIAETYEQIPGGYSYAPELVYPGYDLPPITAETAGRTPIYIIRGARGLENMPSCNYDVGIITGMAAPSDLLSCYVVPTSGKSQTSDASGNFNRASAAEIREPHGTLGRTGGHVFCYFNSPGSAYYDEDMARQTLNQKIRYNQQSGKKPGIANVWSFTYVNGVEVAECGSSTEAYVFPQ